MPVLTLDDRIQRVSDICCISREDSKLLLEKHAWNCDTAICGFFDGELDKLKSLPKTKPVKKESEPNTFLSDNEIQWSKSLPSFQVEAISTESSGSGLVEGTVLYLEPECKTRVSRKKTQIIAKNANGILPAHCRLYQQTGPRDNQRVFVLFQLNLVVYWTH